MYYSEKAKLKRKERIREVNITYEVNNENDLMIQPVIVRQRKPSPPQVQNTSSTPKQSGPRNGKLKIDNNQCCLIFLLGFIFILAIFMATLSIVIGFQNTAKKSLDGNENVDEKMTLVSAAQNGFTHMVKALVKNSNDDEKSEGKGGIKVFRHFAHTIFKELYLKVSLNRIEILLIVSRYFVVTLFSI